MFDLPVTIISGYLGSGKTHYINTLLTENNAVRYAVLVNDFGELNIDAALIKNSSTKSISLANGCVCCSISNDLDAALADLHNIAHTIDWVLLEASGVADSRRIENTVINWPGFKLFQVLTLVDVTRIRKLAVDKYVGAHINKQIQQAENIHLTKTDLISSDELSKTQHWLTSINENPLSDQKLEHHPEYFSYSFSNKNALGQSQLELWLNQLDDNTLRLKGFVFLKDDPDCRYILQWVGQWSSNRELGPQPTSEPQHLRSSTKNSVERNWSLQRDSRWGEKTETQLVMITQQPIQSPFAAISSTGISNTGVSSPAISKS